MVVNKKEFVRQLAKKQKHSQAFTADIVEAFLNTITDNLNKGNTVNFHGFGRFDILERKARSCPNPQTGERCVVPSHWVPRFYPGNAMRVAVKKWEDNEKRGLN